jgi:hypothetical protein
MTNYLFESQVLSQLRTHRSIEQWLGHYRHGDKFMIKFVTLHNDHNEGCYCWYCDYEDVGDYDYCDIYSFYTLDEENEYGHRKSFSNIEEMLDYCYHELGASPLKFVGKGMLQDNYREYLQTKDKC